MEINAQMKIHITWGTHTINDGPGETPPFPRPTALLYRSWSGRTSRRQEGGAVATSVQDTTQCMKPGGERSGRKGLSRGP